MVVTFLIWGVALASIVLMLVRPRGLPEWVWIGGGAALLVATRLLPLRGAVHAIREGVDVYLFLTGMMLLAELAREEGVFDWVADVAAAPRAWFGGAAVHLGVRGGNRGHGVAVE